MLEDIGTSDTIFRFPGIFARKAAYDDRIFKIDIIALRKGNPDSSFGEIVVNFAVVHTDEIARVTIKAFCKA